MDRNLHELDLSGLADLCRNVARTHSADRRQSDTAHALRAEWVRLSVRFRDDKKAEQEALKKRMFEFLSGVPAWMMSGL
jgi:hypothetical protein